jgi:hypothetical protein
MSCELLRLLRNILLRSFVVGYVIILLSAVVTLMGWSTWMVMITQLYHTNEAAIVPLVLAFFTAVKFFLVFALLTPGLALHWTLKRELAAKV